MKYLVSFIFIFLIIITQSCKKDCGLCFSPPSAFEFELVDKLTGENLFTNGTFNSSDIKIINLDDQSNVEFTFIDENDYNVIKINTIGWKTEIVNYSIRISSDVIFDLYVNAERKKGECCSYTEFKEIRIENSDFELNQDTGIYKILVD